MKKQNVAVSRVAQRVGAVTEIADRGVVVENGRSALETTPEALQTDKELLHRYIGV